MVEGSLPSAADPGGAPSEEGSLESDAVPARRLVVALGSNIEDRIQHLCFGLRSLREAGIVLNVLSSVVETPSIGLLHQPPFLNMVALGATHLPPEQVLSIFQRVEREAGRRPGKRNAPRTLDLDLLLYEDWIVRETDLTVPHPRWRGRSFVVVPLAEIAPGLRDPETGWQVKEIARYWPLEPRDIQPVLASEGIEKECEE